MINALISGERAPVYIFLAVFIFPQVPFLSFAISNDKDIPFGFWQPSSTVDLTKGKELLAAISSDSKCSLLIPGLTWLIGRSTDSLVVQEPEKVHGKVIGLLIQCALAENSQSSIAISDSFETCSDERVNVLQRKLTAVSDLRRVVVDKPGWLNIFSGWLGEVQISSKKGIKILALDGGGTKSVVTTTILQKIESSVGGVPLGKVFDVIVGTSAGGLLAIALGCMLMSVKDAEDFVKDIGTNVFANANSSTFKSAIRLWRNGERHSSSYLTKRLKDLLGELSLIDLSAYHGSLCKVCVVATLATSRPASLHLFRNYRVCHKTRYTGSSDTTIPAWLAGRATTAAPTYFSPINVNGHIYQDGALLANNPAHLALHESINLFPHKEIAALVSVGTGNCPWAFGAGLKASISHSVTRDLGTLIYSATSTEATADILADILSEHIYFRFQPQLSDIVELDESDNLVLDKLIAETSTYIQTTEITNRIKKLTANLNGNVKAQKRSKL